MASLRYLMVWRRARGRSRPLPPGPFKAMREALAPFGASLEAVPDGPLPAARDDVVLLMGTPSYFPGTCRWLAAVPESERPVTLLWQVEPLPAPAASGLRPVRRHLREWAKVALRDPRAADPATNLRRLLDLDAAGLLDAVVVSIPWRRETLAEHGIDAEVVPLGGGDHLGRDLGVERDLPVLFLGAPDVPRRRRILRRLARDGLPVVTRGHWAHDRVFGEQRTALLNRAQIVLNLGRHPGELSGMRFALAMTNRALVLSEPIADPRPFVPGVHYVEAPIPELAATGQALLADAPRRARIADAGHRLVLEEASLASSVARLHEIGLAAHGRRGS